MFEKLLAGIFIGLVVVSVILHVHQSYFAFGLLFVVSLLCCEEYFRTQFIIRNRFSFLGHRKYASSHKILNAASARLNQQEEMMQLVIHEIEKIGEDQSNSLSDKIDSNTGQALVRLKEKFESYKKEEATRNWVAEGIALMTHLRKSITGVEDYAYQVISHLVKYMKANQGVFYLLRGEGEDQVLELAASYAYGKRKHTDGKVTISTGTGLLGQCIKEKDIIFLSQIPKDYIKIASGLGEAAPNCILIAPLIFGGQVYGAIEIASFEIFEDYQLDFSRKVCDNIAVELSAMIIHENTERLLEQTIQAQEQMKQKEHQISTKLLEVEAERSKNIAILNGCMDGVISFDERGIIGFANVAAEEIFDRKSGTLLGFDIRNLLAVNIIQNAQREKIVITSSGNEVSIRTEVSTENNDLSLLLTSARVKMDEGYLFTLFIQKISVDLF